MNNKIILAGSHLMLITEAGIIYSTSEGNPQLYTQLLTVQDEDEIKQLLLPEVFRAEQAVKEEIKKYAKTVSNFEILTNTGLFTEKDGAVYMEGINRSLPAILIDVFAVVIYQANETDLDQHVPFVALSRFWKKCCLCPNAQSAEDLYRFLASHNMKITANGNFLAYRRVVSRGNENKPLIEFVSNQYTKIKARKKGPKNYLVSLNSEGEYELSNEAGDGLRATERTVVGNLQDLYLELPTLQAEGYTDAHTRSFDYRVGEICRISRDLGDDNNKVSCGKGLHAASKAYDYRGFGDTDILVIINPIHVLAVPQNEDGKLRTAAFYFACTLAEDERHILDDEDFDVTELDDLFEEKMMDILEQDVMQGYAEEVKRHTFTMPAVNTSEVRSIVFDLKKIKKEISNRVNQFEK